MINDHTDRYQAPAWHTKTHSPRMFARKNRLRAEHGSMLWKTVGMLIIVSLIIGVASTLWFGNRIRTALDDIGEAKEIQIQLVNRNKELQTKRSQLLDRTHIEAVAKGLGLYPPTAGQKRTP